MSLQWTYQRQFDRYQSFDRICPTFLILGIGGTPTQPDFVTVMPISMTSIDFHMKQVKPFEVNVKQAITPDVLWSTYSL